MTAQPLTTSIVVDTAADIADADGFDSVSLARVARELGTSQPALYRHVDGIDGLVRALGLRGRTILAERLLQAAVGRSADDAVRAMGLAWRGVVQDHPGVYAATDRYPCAGDAELEAAVERVVGVLGEALVGFGLDEADRVHAGRALRSAFHGFSHLESGDGHPLDVDVDESFDQLIGLLCAGIRSLASADATTADQSG
ncbi:MAG: TetR/AcrR family transcriptional regulator [Actinomycetota bacterium]